MVETKAKLGRISLDTCETIYNLDYEDARLRLHAFCGTGVCTHINQSQLLMGFNLSYDHQWLDEEEIAMVRDGGLQFCLKNIGLRDLSQVLNRPGAFLTAVKGIIMKMVPADAETIVTWSEKITQFAIEAAHMGGRKRTATVIMVIELSTVNPNPEVAGGGDCAVCFGGLDTGRKVATLPCSHSFHSLCLALWFEEKEQCPLCRAKGTMFSV